MHLRLGAKLCEPHTCPSGVLVNCFGLHSLSCKKSSGRINRHQLLNDIIWRAFRCAGIPAIKEPIGLCRADGKRPDGLTQIPWESGKCLTWDVTVTDTLAVSNLSLSAAEAGSALERKSVKYTKLTSSYDFVSLAFETIGPINSSGAEFIKALGKRIRAMTGEPRETSFLWQRISVAIQRFNGISLQGTFEADQQENFKKS